MTGLVEWPVALRGSFDESFLTVPRQALISSMREHQKYFHIERRDGELVPSFITISNIESKRAEAVVYGNEKVIRPRLADAAFFFDTDKQTTLASKALRLESVLFQRDLGTLAEKQTRISEVAQTLSQTLGADKATVKAAGCLIKADLVSDMVGEFPELQGIAGRHYALHDGRRRPLPMPLSNITGQSFRVTNYPSLRVGSTSLSRQTRYADWHLWNRASANRIERPLCAAPSVTRRHSNTPRICPNGKPRNDFDDGEAVLPLGRVG